MICFVYPWWSRASPWTRDNLDKPHFGWIFRPAWRPPLPIKYKHIHAWDLKFITSASVRFGMYECSSAVVLHANSQEPLIADTKWHISDRLSMTHQVAFMNAAKPRVFTTAQVDDQLTIEPRLITGWLNCPRKKEEERVGFTFHWYSGARLRREHIYCTCCDRRSSLVSYCLWMSGFVFSYCLYVILALVRRHVYFLHCSTYTSFISLIYTLIIRPTNRQVTLLSI